LAGLTTTRPETIFGGCYVVRKRRGGRGQERGSGKERGREGPHISKHG